MSLRPKFLCLKTLSQDLSKVVKDNVNVDNVSGHDLYPQHLRPRTSIAIIDVRDIHGHQYHFNLASNNPGEIRQGSSLCATVRIHILSVIGIVIIDR
jgi:hypothetical protein